MASFTETALCGFAVAAAFVAMPNKASAQESTANTAPAESTAAPDQNSANQQSKCVSYGRIDSNLTIVGSGTRAMLSGNTSIQVAITPERNFFIFENNSEDPTEGCYEAKLRGTDFKGNDYTVAQPTPTSLTFSTEEARQQCRDLGFEEGTCVSHDNLSKNASSNLNTAFTGTLNGDNVITFQATTSHDGGWTLFRTFNRGATALAMFGTDFEWAPEVRKFYEERRP